LFWGQFLLHGDKDVAKRSSYERYDLLVAFLVNSILVILTCVCLTPQWETNDDAAMAMIVNGKGLVAEASSQLIFSNLFWGQIIRLSTLVFGYFGYSIGIFGSVVVSGTVIYYTLRKSGCLHSLCIAVITLISLRPLLLPQFTLSAGLSMIAALCLLQLFARTQKPFFLLVSCVLAYISYVIRSQEAALVVIVALPTFATRSLFKQRKVRAAALCIAIAMIGSSIVDYLSYQSSDWKAFNEINLARAPYTDFGAGALLEKRPDIYEAQGLSSNDATLVTGWGLYAVPSLATPAVLEAMLAGLGFQIVGHSVIQNLSLALAALASPYLKFLFISAIVALMFCQRRRPVLISWFLFICVVFLLGILGRPAIFRVYYPLLGWLLVAPMLSNVGEIRQRVASLIFTAALIGNAISVYTQLNATPPFDGTELTGLKSLDREPLYVWGGLFPFETAFSPTHDPTSIINLRIYGFGVFTPAPFSVASHESAKGKPFERQILLPQGLFIMASDQDLSTLAIYCKEHHEGELHIDRVGAINEYPIQKVRCTPSP